MPWKLCDPTAIASGSPTSFGRSGPPEPPGACFQRHHQCFQPRRATCLPPRRTWTQRWLLRGAVAGQPSAVAAHDPQCLSFISLSLPDFQLAFIVRSYIEAWIPPQSCSGDSCVLALPSPPEVRPSPILPALLASHRLQMSCGLLPPVTCPPLFLSFLVSPYMQSFPLTLTHPPHPLWESSWSSFTLGHLCHPSCGGLHCSQSSCC